MAFKNLVWIMIFFVLISSSYALITDDIPGTWDHDERYYNFFYDFEADNSTVINDTSLSFASGDYATKSFLDSWADVFVTADKYVTEDSTVCVKFKNTGTYYQTRIAENQDWSKTKNKSFIYRQPAIIELGMTGGTITKSISPPANIQDWQMECFYHNNTQANSTIDINLTTASPDLGGSWDTTESAVYMMRGYDGDVYIDWMAIFNGSDARYLNGSSPQLSETLNVTGSFPHNEYFNGSSVKLNTSANASVSFNCSSYIDGVLNQTITDISAGLNKLVEFNMTYNKVVEEDYFYHISCKNEYNIVNTAQTNFYIDKISPSISILDNNGFDASNNTRVNNYGSELPLNISFSDGLGVTRTEVIIRDYSDVVKHNATTIGLNKKNHNYNESVDVSLWSPGVYTVSIISEDNIHKVMENYSWYHGTSNLSYDKEAITNEVTNFFANITNSSKYVSIKNATFWFNGTEKQNTKTSFDLLTSFNTSNVVNSVPINPTPYDFYWNITTLSSNGTEYSVELSGQQNVTTLILNICNASFTTPGINFTLFNESTNNRMYGDLTIDFKYWLSGKENLAQTYSYIGTNHSNYTFCISPGSATIYANYTAYYSATNYPERRYTANSIAIDNSVTQVPLYLLLSSEGIYTRIQAVDQYQNAISGVKIKMEKFIDGAWTTIEQQLTDDSGLSTFWVNPDDDHKFTLTKSGYTQQQINIRPTLGDPYIVTMESESTSTTYDDHAGVSYSFEPNNQALSNNTVYNFNFTLNSSYWDINDCEFSLKDSDGNTLIVGAPDFNTRICSGSINYNTGDDNKTITSQIVWSHNGANNIIEEYTYSTGSSYVGQFSLKNFFDDIKNFTGAGFSTFTLNILAFIAIILLIVGAASTTNLNTYISDGLIILTIFVTLGFSYIKWLHLPVTTPLPNFIGIHQYLIFYLVTMGGVGFLVWRHNG